MTQITQLAPHTPHVLQQQQQQQQQQPIAYIDAPQSFLSPGMATPTPVDMATNTPGSAPSTPVASDEPKLQLHSTPITI